MDFQMYVISFGKLEETWINSLVHFNLIKDAKITQDLWKSRYQLNLVKEKNKLTVNSLMLKV